MKFIERCNIAKSYTRCNLHMTSVCVCRVMIVKQTKLFKLSLGVAQYLTTRTIYHNHKRWMNKYWAPGRKTWLDALLLKVQTTQNKPQSKVCSRLPQIYKQSLSNPPPAYNIGKWYYKDDNPPNFHNWIIFA